MVQPDGYESGPTCIPNIGLQERRKRLRTGIIALTIAALIGLFLIFSDWAWWTRFVVFVFFFSGFLGIFQAQDET